jgi:hypothetical protein
VIGKITKGKNFGGLLNYVFSKDTAEYIGGNMIGKTTEELNREFNIISTRNERVQKPVAHISLSPSPTEKVSDEKMLWLVSEYMDRMGFKDSQWIMAKHSDTETPDGKTRPHYHVIANRVKTSDNRVVPAWQDWKRTEKILRDLEKEFGMAEVASSWEVERSAPSTGQQRRKNRERAEYEAGLRKTPPDEAIKVILQRGIDEAALDKITMPQLMVRLEEEWGIKARVGITRTGKIKGISYSKDGVHLSGTQLGKAYTFPGLQKYRGINYLSERDDEVIKRFNEQGTGQNQTNIQPRITDITNITEKAAPETRKPTGSGTASDENPESKAGERGSSSTNANGQKHHHFVANILAKYLNSLSTNEIEGKKYIGRWNGKELTLEEKRESQEPNEILRVQYDEKNRRWIELASQLRENHIKDFEAIEKEIKLKEKEKKRQTPTLE